MELLDMKKGAQKNIKNIEDDRNEARPGARYHDIPV